MEFVILRLGKREGMAERKDALAAMLRRGRIAKGWSHAEVAKRVGVSRVAITNWEGDEMPTVPNLTKICAVLGLPMFDSDTSNGPDEAPITKSLLASNFDQSKYADRQPPSVRLKEEPDEGPLVDTAKGTAGGVIKKMCAS